MSKYGKWQRVNRQIQRKRKSNYPSFEKSLEFHFEEDIPQSRTELSRQMKLLGFHPVNNKKEFPTEKQLDFAWEFIKRNYIKEQKKLEYFFKTEEYHKHYVHRANQNIVYHGKRYRKGQFLPKEMIKEYE